jgi:hypothetical protein
VDIRIVTWLAPGADTSKRTGPAGGRTTEPETIVGGSTILKEKSDPSATVLLVRLEILIV